MSSSLLWLQIHKMRYQRMIIYLIGEMMQQCIAVTLSCQTGRNPGTYMQLTQTHSLPTRLYSKQLQVRRAFARQTSGTSLCKANIRTYACSNSRPSQAPAVKFCTYIYLFASFPITTMSCIPSFTPLLLLSQMLKHSKAPLHWS